MVAASGRLFLLKAFHNRQKAYKNLDTYLKGEWRGDLIFNFITSQPFHNSRITVVKEQAEILIQAHNRVHIILAQLKIENAEILCHPFFAYRFGNSCHAALGQPAQYNLGNSSHTSASSI
jgi:hypothetical protein